ncbi:hypothetical protein CVT26_005414 [Gymnopilus dilepis]|uniref:Uncharacterized protein n=1 Tax=Gymnopilus dilepis TaxID=231916 RepID=A0A409WGK6_9AGAR|nr:hypothetical protein CVT26_005414 [Gymnopilus dilepis]
MPFLCGLLCSSFVARRQPPDIGNLGMQTDNQSTILFLARRFREAVEDFSSNGAFLPIVFDAGFESFMVESISGGKSWESFAAAAREKKIFVRELPPSDVPEEDNAKFAAHSAVIKDILEHLEKTPAHLDLESGHEKEELLVQIRSHLNLLRAIVDHAWQLHKTEQRRKFFFLSLKHMFPPELMGEGGLPTHRLDHMDKI